MSTSTDPKVDPLARVISLGNAPVTQSGAGGQWVNAWSVTGVTAVEKADATNANEAWTALKYTDLLATTLAGGDIYKGDLGVSGQSSATSTVKQEIDGKEALRFNLSEAAQSVTISLSSFFANDDGSAYAEGARARLFDANGVLVGESFVHADSADGNKTVQIASNLAFRSVEISAGAQKADGSFSFGAYTNADGSFGADSYTSGTKHGSDFLVHAISFAVARPAAAGDSYTLDQDAPAASFASVLANDRDANNAPLSAVLDTTASHGTLSLNADGSFTYQPAAHYVGEDSFTYRATNGKDSSDAAVVHLIVNAVNHAPVGANDSVSTDERTLVTGNVLNGASGGLDTDSDGDSLAVSSAGTFITSLGATVTLNANGDFSYDPSASAALQALGVGESRVDGFDYSIADGHGGVATAHVDVTVSGVADPGGGGSGGEAVGILPSVAADTPLSYYMRYTTSAGTSDWMKIDGMASNIESETAVLQGTGVAVGKPVPSAVTLQMGTGKALADFTTSLLKGTPVGSIEIEAYAGNGAEPRLVQEYRFGTNFVTAAQTGAGADGATANTVSFVYKTVDQAVTLAGPDGKPLAPLDFQWDVPAMKASVTDRVDPGADADLARLAPMVDSSAPLDYYVHVDGIDGWVALSSFAMGYTAETSYLKGSGAAVGKATPQELSLGLGLGQVLTKLMANAVTGMPARDIQVEAYTRDPMTGAAKLADEYIFSDAFTTKVDSSGGAAGTVDLVYKSFTHSHLAYDAMGKLVNTSATGYDVAQSMPASAPPARADAAGTLPIPSIPADTSLSYYIRYTTAAGTSAWMKIDGMSSSIAAEAGIVKGSGAATGMAIPSAVTLQMGTGKALADFTTSLLKGTQVSNIEIEAYAASGAEPRLVQEYRFGGNFVTAAQTGAGADGATSNTVSFVYKTVDQAVTVAGRDGKPLAPVDFQWDVAANKTSVADRVDAGADADLVHLAPMVDSTAPLDYYIHVDGIDGWVALSGFSMGYMAETSVLKGTGVAVGKPLPQELSLELGLSQVLTKLMSNEIAGLPARDIQVEAYTRDPQTGAAVLADEYIFNDAVTTKVDSSAGAASTVDLVYKSFTHSHLAYDATGKLVDTSATGYDVAHAMPASAPAARPDADGSAPIPSVDAATPLSYYMRYTTNAGTSAWMKIDGMASGIASEAAIVQGGVAAVGNATPGPVTLQMGTGKALADFTTSLLKGTQVNSIEIEAYAGSGAEPRLVQEYRFGGNFVTSAQTGAGADGATANTVSFVYKTVDQAVTLAGRDGKPLAPVDFQWDVPGMKPSVTDRVHVGADADLVHLAPMVDSSAPLDYYVHVDGIDGWVALSSFDMGYTAEATYLKGSGAAVGKPAPQELSLGLGLSQVLTKLMANEITGVSVRNIQVEAYFHDPRTGEAKLADEYIFSDAFTTKVDSSGGAANTVDLVYKSFTHSHLAYNATGKLADTSGSGYDFAKAIVIGAPAPHADVFM